MQRPLGGKEAPSHHPGGLTQIPEARPHKKAKVETAQRSTATSEGTLVQQFAVQNIIPSHKPKEYLTYDGGNWQHWETWLSDAVQTLLSKRNSCFCLFGRGGGAQLPLAVNLVGILDDVQQRVLPGKQKGMGNLQWFQTPRGIPQKLL